eukprot:m.60554 g.60554  ORF g.60554 m.60554 type:complete len:91 (+) comp11823_c0_seq1:1338-1610(+)
MQVLAQVSRTTSGEVVYNHMHPFMAAQSGAVGWGNKSEQQNNGKMRNKNQSKKKKSTNGTRMHKAVGLAVCRSECNAKSQSSLSRRGGAG